MKQQLMGLLALLAVILLAPYIITLVWTGRIEGMPVAAMETIQGRMIVDDYETMSAMDLEDFLVGVVAAQIPVEYELEALKCQAIIARTFLYYEMGERNEMVASSFSVNYLGESDLKNLWGKEDYPVNKEKLIEAVNTTKGMIIYNDGALITPMFHRASAGQTRQADESHGFLKSVTSSEDLEIEGYLSIAIFTPTEFCEKLRVEYREDISENIQIIERDEGGYVTSIQVGNDIFDGDQFQMLLELDSPCFTIENFENKIRIISKGIGHGFGFSQWGGNKLAIAGSSAEEILTYYYKNIEIISE